MLKEEIETPAAIITWTNGLGTTPEIHPVGQSELENERIRMLLEARTVQRDRTLLVDKTDRTTRKSAKKFTDSHSH